MHLFIYIIPKTAHDRQHVIHKCTGILVKVFCRGILESDFQLLMVVGKMIDICRSLHPSRPPGQAQ